MREGREGQRVGGGRYRGEWNGGKGCLGRELGLRGGAGDGGRSHLIQKYTKSITWKPRV